MKFYITKYALTQGIIELDSNSVRSLKVEEGRLLYFDSLMSLYSYGPGEWYTEKPHAIADAEYRKKKKIASLQKQIAKLEKLTFTVPGADEPTDPDESRYDDAFSQEG